jgi:hypothetical protein
LFFPIASKFGWDVRAGYSHFPGSSGASDVDVWNLAGNLKYFLIAGSTWEPFVNGGPGLYFIDGAGFEAGVNLGVGIARKLSPDLTLEGTYNLHSVLSASPDVRFGQFQAGLLFSF